MFRLQKVRGLAAVNRLKAYPPPQHRALHLIDFAMVNYSYVVNIGLVNCQVVNADLRAETVE